MPDFYNTTIISRCDLNHSHDHLWKCDSRPHTLGGILQLMQIELFNVKMYEACMNVDSIFK